jgi:hypothetical protein
MSKPISLYDVEDDSECPHVQLFPVYDEENRIYCGGCDKYIHHSKNPRNESK